MSAGATSGLWDSGGIEGIAAMDIDLTSPIFHDEAKATAHMEADRWPDGVWCPDCGSTNVHKMGGKTQAGTSTTLREKIVTTVDRRSYLMADELASYTGVGKEFARHDSVNHSQDEYVRGDRARQHD
jgi:hypothetical protein